MKKWIENIIGIIVFGGICFTFYWGLLGHDEYVDSCLKEGYYSTTASFKGSSKKISKWELVDNHGKIIDFVGDGGLEYYSPGEQFVAEICEKNNDVIKILFDQPLIDERLFANSKTIAVKSNYHLSTSTAKFTYEYNGKTYMRKVRTLKTSLIEDSRQYLVKVKKDDPRIAYVYFDSLVIK